MIGSSLIVEEFFTVSNFTVIFYYLDSAWDYQDKHRIALIVEAC
jgi:hypothetical protein